MVKMRTFRTRTKYKHSRNKPSLTFNEQMSYSWKTIFVIFTCGYSLMVASITIYLFRNGYFKNRLHSIVESGDGNKRVPAPPVMREFPDFPSDSIERKSPCFGPKTFTFHNESFGSQSPTHAHLSKTDVIRIGQYLSKFHNSTNQTLLHLPDWTSRLFNDTTPNITLTNDRGIRPPYFLSAVVRLRLYERDEAKLTMAELKQWIHYQFWAGAEHIYICNHYLTESERIEPHLHRYIDLGLVTVYPWNNITSIPGSPTYLKDNSDNQDGCYNHVLERHSSDSVWQYNMDMDEYPYVPGDQCEGFFKRFLFNLDTGHREFLVTQVKLRNFLMKGVGDRTRDMLIDRINRIDRKESNPLVKPCYKLKYTTRVGTHGVTTTQGQTILPAPHDLVMVHYWGSRTQNWGPDTHQTLRETRQFNDIRETIAVNVKHSLLVFGDFQGFNNKTGP